MALQMKLASAIAMVTGEAREKNLYAGQGDQQQKVGRKTDRDGRPLSSVAALVIAEPVGVLDNATVLLPDLQLAGIAPHTAIRLEGELVLMLRGKEYSVIASELTAERMTPLGSWVEWVEAAAAAAAAGKKPVEARAS